MRLRYKLLAALSVLVGVFLYGRCSRSKPKSPISLPAADTEQIIVNPSNHTITIVNAKGKTTETLPDRPSTIDVLKTGQVKVTSPQLGLEFRPFVGVQMSSAFHIVGGLDLLYFKRLDLGLGFGGEPGNHTPIVFAKVSYNIWSNVGAGVTYDNNQHIGLALTVRL
jgi:hypothetical protein